MPSNKKECLSFSQQFKLISAHANYYLIFASPLIFTLIIDLLIQKQLYPVSKNVLEAAALIVLGVFFLISVAQFAFKKDKYFIWASCLLLAFLIREIHPPGSSLGIYIGVLLLLHIAHKQFYNFIDYFDNKKFVNLIAMGFFTYFIAVTIDQRFWKFVPGEEVAHVPLEESLELIGHFLVGFSLTLISSKARPLK